MVRVLAVIAVLVAVAAPAGAQTREVTGTVRRAYTGQPAANAEVMVVGEQSGVCTNVRGEYRLSVPAGNVSLIARTSEFLSRPTTIAPTEVTAALAIDPRVQWPASQGPGWVFARLVVAPEIEIVRGKMYFDGVELPIPAESRCGSRTPNPQGSGS